MTRDEVKPGQSYLWSRGIKPTVDGKRRYEKQSARCDVLGPAERRKMGHIRVWVFPCRLHRPESPDVVWLEARTLSPLEGCDE